MTLMSNYVLYWKYKIRNYINNNNNNTISSSGGALINKKKIWNLPISRIFGKLFLIYIFVVLISGFILSIPGIVLPSGRNVFDINGKCLGFYNFSWNYLIGLFMAASAFSDTGLTIPCLAVDYTFFGQLIVMLLIQIGGFGVLTFKIMILILFRCKISIKDRMLVQSERGSSSFGQTMDLIKNGFLFLVVIEIFMAVILFFVFYFSSVTSNISKKYDCLIYNVTYHSFWKSLWSGIFHSVSAINNAGFDIVGNSSLIVYNDNYFLQIIFMIEFIIGGLGFPTFYDIKRKILGWKYNERTKFSLFTKINFITYVLVSIIGVLIVWLIEYFNMSSVVMDSQKNTVFIESIIKGSSSSLNAFMNILFNTMSTRNAGFSTIEMGKLLPGSKIVMIIMMFIGSAPSSTAGGIRTTTFAIIVITIWSIIQNNNNVNAFKRKIPDETVKMALAVAVISSVLVVLSTLIISIENPTLDCLNLFFVSSSAFGTTGLNVFGFVDMYNLGIISLIFIILLMFIGQLGVSSTLLIGIKNTCSKEYSYVEENIQIG